VLALVIVLVVTNVVTAAALLYLRLRPTPYAQPTDEAVRAALDAFTQRGTGPTKDRQFVSIEILNPIELAYARGRVLGIAGSFAPAFTRRLVYDQTVKTVRDELNQRGVVADVHVHAIRKVETAAQQPPPGDARTIVIEPGEYVDDIDVPAELPKDQPPV